MARVGVRFALDADGMLTVTAKEESTGQSASIEIQPMHGLTDDEVEGMLEAGFEHAREDFDRRRVVELHTELGTMLHAIGKNLDSARGALDPESVAELEEAVAAAEAAKQQDELPVVQGARDRLEQASLPLAAVLMDGVVKQAVEGKRLDEV